ncbi:DCC1-like thiol-disulfide oxidoreductase family protein [Inquilinus sp. Marseille-Q2685]|uniref:DCC1-like thiol-disulfide oxidoreductase family protein n=1 Tax=Inquilinus sp. Marseille-Q2685 TaxID=2866581 RepID=UPI001CE42DBF|nr:DCC1-like thiol-disulfide oxidoreductase family protein [Inquilinus sp. Marseille-Q2685]
MNTTAARQSGHGPGENGHRSADASDEILLVYDWECPACDTYCQWVRIQPTAGRLRLVNARDLTPVMEEITKAGLDIDQGMVVRKGGQLYYGSEAIHTLALLSNRSGLFNKLSHYVFRSRALSHLLYPGLRACRNLLLKVLGKTKINNLRIEGNDRF